MGMYEKGDHVKIEVTNEQSAETEWMWLLVDRSDDAELSPAARHPLKAAQERSDLRFCKGLAVGVKLRQ